MPPTPPRSYASEVPPYEKSIVCLANSRKPPSGRCIAGIEYSAGVAGGWIRPVSERLGLEISEEERRYQDGTHPEVLDVVKIAFKTTQPLHHQTENHVIHDGYYWAKIGRLAFAALFPMVQVVPSLWVDGYSTYHGRNDHVPQALAMGITHSLVLIRPKKVELIVVAESQFSGGTRNRIRAEFSVGSSDYGLVVTHPEIEQEFLGYGYGRYDLSGSILCVSLADYYAGSASKLVATVIRP